MLSNQVIDHMWKMYQQGQASADHTAKEVFASTLQSLADWLPSQQLALSIALEQEWLRKTITEMRGSIMLREGGFKAGFDTALEEIEAHCGLVAAAPVRAAVVPDGYVLVPMEPTPEMLDQFHGSGEYERLAWQKMLAAIPSPAPVQPAPVGDDTKRMQDNEVDIEIALSAMTSAGINSVFPTNMRHRINVALDAVDTARRLRTKPPADAAPVEAVGAFYEAVPKLTRDQVSHPNDTGRPDWCALADDTVLQKCIDAAVAAQATPAKAVDERVKFEKWAQLTSHRLNGVHHDVAGWYYFDSDTENCWQAWQARALAAPSNSDLPAGWTRAADGRVQPPAGENGTAYSEQVKL